MRFKMLLITCSFVAFFSLPAFAQEDEAIHKAGTITFFIGAPGDITVRHAAEDTRFPVSLKMEVLRGDVVNTGAESRLEITLLDRSILRIGELTELEINEAVFEKRSKKVDAKLKKGKIWANVSKLSGRNDEFQVTAPTAVCAVRGTIYRIQADSATTVLVYDGSVNVGPTWKGARTPEEAAPRGLQPVEIPAPYEIPPPYEVSLDEWIEIVAGFQISVRADRKYAKSRFDAEADAALEWVRWNRDRDMILRRN